MLKDPINDHPPFNPPLATDPRLLDAILTSSTDHIYVLDRAGRFVYTSLVGAQALGMDRTALIGKTGAEIGAPPDVVAQFDAERAVVLGTGQAVRGSVRYPTAQGERDYEYTFAPILNDDGSVEAVLFTGVDVEDRNLRERERRRLGVALRQQSAAFENMWDALIVTDLEGRISECNAAFVRLSGFSREETLGQPISFLHLPEEREWVMPQIAEGMLRDGRWEGEVRFLRKDGSHGVSLTSVVPLRDEAGNVIGTVGANRDITEIKRTQEENLRLLERDVAAAERQKGFLKDVLRSVSEGKLRLVDDPTELPKPLPQVGRPVRLDSTGKIYTLRHQAQRAAVKRGLNDLRWQHLVTAVSEAAMNAVVHAGGGVGRVCASADMVQVWVEDRGRGISYDILPRATLEKGWSSGSSLGHGFWLMLNTVDRVWLLTSETGTTVVVEEQREEPLPEWLGELRV